MLDKLSRVQIRPSVLTGVLMLSSAEAGDGVFQAFGGFDDVVAFPEVGVEELGCLVVQYVPGVEAFVAGDGDGFRPYVGYDQFVNTGVVCFEKAAAPVAGEADRGAHILQAGFAVGKAVIDYHCGFLRGETKSRRLFHKKHIPGLANIGHIQGQFYPCEGEELLIYI